ncbi:hypothetical protein ACMDLT_004676, partial [Salmonella enterica]
FGGVRRDTSTDYSGLGVRLASGTQTISVSCAPQPDNASPYTVSLTFTGDTSDIYNFAWAAKGALKTSISDLFILPENPVTGDSLPVSPVNSTSIPLSLDTTTGYYNLSVKWNLIGYSGDGKVPDAYGPFTATATYTVDVN